MSGPMPGGQLAIESGLLVQFGEVHRGVARQSEGPPGAGKPDGHGVSSKSKVKSCTHVRLLAAHLTR